LDEFASKQAPGSMKQNEIQLIIRESAARMDELMESIGENRFLLSCGLVPSGKDFFIIHQSVSQSAKEEEASAAAESGQDFLLIFLCAAATATT
jgi:hypothetical protein